MCINPAFLEKRDRSPEEEESDGRSDKDELDAAKGSNDNESVSDEDDESVLDESSDEDLDRNKRKGKRKSGNRQLRMQVQSAQGKSTSEDGRNSKRKASENQEL